MNKRAINYILAGVIVAAVAAAYLSSFAGVFLFDDLQAILRNSNVVGDKAVFSGHRWLVDLTFRINLSLWGENPFSFHAVNLLIHAANALLLFGIARRVFGKIIPAESGSAIRPSLSAWAAALIWAVHPLTTQAVTYICQRYESMTALFMLGALYFFIRAMESARKQRLFFNVSLAALILGMGCKETMAVMPVILLIYDYVFSGETLDQLAKKRGLFHIASFLTIFVLLGYQMQLAASQIDGTHHGSRLGQADGLSYLLAQGPIILHYFKLSVWPVGLCFDYAWKIKPVGWFEVAAFLLHALLFCSALFGIVKKRGWGFMVGAFYILLAPTSSVVPVADLAVEHRMYAPLMILTSGFAGILFACICRSRRIARPSAVFVTVTMMCAVALGLRTSVRNMYYWSEKAMWEDVCSKRPDNLRARNDLAAALSARGSVEQALEEYEEVISRIPPEVKASCDQGRSAVTGNFIKSSPEYAYYVACANLGTMYCNQLRDYDTAFEWYIKALRISPLSSEVRRSAGNILRAFGRSEDEVDHVLDEAILKSIEGQDQ